MYNSVRNAQVAEWILSLVTSPDRAAATVGDLMEDIASRGSVWFWIGVLQTAFSIMWREVGANPGRMARLAGGAFLMGWVWTFVCFAVIIPLAMALRPGDPNVWASWIFTVPSILVVMFLVPFQQGRWVARRSSGQELAPCLALTFATAVLSVITAAYFRTGVFETVFSVTLGPIPTFAGAAWVRRQRLSH